MDKAACARNRRGWFELLTGVCLLACAQPAHCQIYAGSTSSGSLVLSNFPFEQAREIVLPAPLQDAPARSPIAESSPLDVPDIGGAVAPDLRRIVDSVASRTALSPQLIHAVIATESRYRRDAVSNRGAIGLMQLIPATAKRFGAQDPFDPYQNISAGAAYLKWLMGQFEGDLELVLAAYNAGEQAVIKAGRRIPPYAETRAYVKKVMATLRAGAAAAL